MCAVLATSGCWWPPAGEPATGPLDRRTVVEKHSTTQAPGSPHTVHERPPAPVNPPPPAGMDEEPEATDAE